MPIIDTVTGNLVLDMSILVAAQLVILLIPWVAPHVVYIGDINPRQYGEQAATALRARLFLALPATVALCWFGVSRLDTGNDLMIMLYLAVICRLVLASARVVRAARPVLSWIFSVIIGPLIAWAAVLRVARYLAANDPSVATWVFGGFVALVGPPALVAMAGWFADRRLSTAD